VSPLEALARVVAVFYADDPSTAGVSVAWLDGKWYASVCRYTGTFGRGKVVVVKSASATLDDAVVKLAATWIERASFVSSQVEADVRSALYGVHPDAAEVLRDRILELGIGEGINGQTARQRFLDAREIPLIRDILSVVGVFVRECCHDQRPASHNSAEYLAQAGVWLRGKLNEALECADVTHKEFLALSGIEPVPRASATLDDAVVKTQAV
jgi:hypothetical protein